MGFRFRKSVKAGPFRINFSKSGIGYSFGGKGFRVTKKAGGGTRTTASIPGTGVSYVKDYGSRKKKTSSNAPVSSGSSGSTPKKPIYQRPWFVALMVIVLLGAVGSACGSDDATKSDENIVQQEETVDKAEQETADAKTDTVDVEDPAETANTQEDPEPVQEPDSDPEPVQEPQNSLEDPQKPTTSQNTAQSTPAVSESQESSGSAPAVVTPPASTPATQPEPEPAPAPTEQKTGYVGSIDSDKYHSPGCRWAKKILPENEIWFATKEDAVAAGYSPCGTCQ